MSTLLLQLKIRRRGSAPADTAEHNVDFWAQTGAGAAAGGDGDDDFGGEDNTAFGGFGDGPAPFNTQILNDDDEYDDGFAEFADPDGNDVDVTPGADGEGAEEDLMQTAGQLHRVKPENVNYAKRAKRVDVKKLKDTIWKELKAVAIEVDRVSAAI